MSLDDHGCTLASGASGSLTRGPLRRLRYSLLPGNLGVFVVTGGLPAVLLPLQVGALDTAHKVGNLTLVTSVGAAATMLTQPIVGVLSDHTRSRFGRRAPWMVGGAIAGVLALVATASSSTISTLVIAWAGVQVAYGAVHCPATAILPDRVPPAARGRFATMLGLAITLGGLLGSGLGAVFAASPGTAYVLVGTATTVLVVAFVAVNPDSPSVERDVRGLDVAALLRSFSIHPVRHPDFARVLVGRLLLYTAYFSVSGFLLFLLQDYVGLKAAAPAVVPLLLGCSLVGTLASSAVTGLLSDRYRYRKPFVVTASVLIALAVAIPWASPTVAGMIAMAATSGIGFGTYQAVDIALLTEVLPDETATGKDLGVVNIASTLPQAIAPALGAAVVQIGSYSGLFPFAIALSLLGALSVQRVRTVR